MFKSNSLTLSEKHAASAVQPKLSSPLYSNSAALKYIGKSLADSNTANNDCFQCYNLNVGKLATSRYSHKSQATNKTSKEKARNKNTWKKCYSPHHIIPNCVVTHSIAPVMGPQCYNLFNQDWNGIMLPRSPVQRRCCLYKNSNTEKAYRLPAHLKDSHKCDHPSYSAQVYTLVEAEGDNKANLDCLKRIADFIRGCIKSSDAIGNPSLCLDDIRLAKPDSINTNDYEDPYPGDTHDDFDYDEEMTAAEADFNHEEDWMLDYDPLNEPNLRMIDIHSMFRR